MLKAFHSFMFHKVMGWKIVGNPPHHLPKFIMIVIPHTSWHDFPVGVFARGVMQMDIKFIGKKALFKPPHGWIFKALGGYPVDRSKSNNFVQSVADAYNSEDKLRMVIAPEGTRKQVTKLKSGFYWIAKLANIPIVPVAFDFERKEVQIMPEYYPTDDMEGDMDKIWRMFEGVKGKIPEYSLPYKDDIDKQNGV